MRSRKQKFIESGGPIFFSILIGISATPRATAAGSSSCTSKAGPNGMTQQFCDAGNASKKAADANKMAAGFYGAAGAICGVACGLEYTGYGTAYARASCTIGSVGAGVGDFVQTKDFMGAVGSLFSIYTGAKDVKEAAQGIGKSLGSIGGSSAMAGGGGVNQAGTVGISQGNGVTTFGVAESGPVTMQPIDASGKAVGEATTTGGSGAAAGGTQEPDSSTCLSAALNVASAGMKIMSSNKADDAAQKNFDNAAQVANHPNGAPPPSFESASGGATGGTSAASGSTSASNAQGLTHSGGGGDTCASARETGNISSALSCAAASGASIPAIAKDPRFAEMLKKATGMDPSEFMKKAMNEPGKAVAAGVINGMGLTGDAAMKTAAAYAQLEKMGYDAEAGAYAGSGGGRRPAGGDDGMSNMMAGLLGALGPKKEGEDQKNAGNLLKFGQKLAERYPANADQDRRISLFDRVTHRYKMVSGRVLPSTFPASLR